MKLPIFIILVTLGLALQAQPCARPFFSEYVESWGNNKAIEIYNPTPSPWNLEGYKVLRFANGSQTPTEQIILKGIIAPYDVYVIVNGQRDTFLNAPPPLLELQTKADTLDASYPAVCYFNGDDALALVKSHSPDINNIEEVLDIFGKIGERPKVAWTDAFPFDGSIPGRWLTLNKILRRKVNIKAGVFENPPHFSVLEQWEVSDIQDFSGLGQHQCDCKQP
jgi:hypothetical protein